MPAPAKPCSSSPAVQRAWPTASVSRPSTRRSSASSTPCRWPDRELPAMYLARVVGTVVCTHKDARLSGVTLLVIQPLGRDGNDAGRALVATDTAGAGVGERV